LNRALVELERLSPKDYYDIGGRIKGMLEILRSGDPGGPRKNGDDDRKAVGED